MFLYDPAKVQQNTKPSPAPFRCWPAADTGSVSPTGAVCVCELSQ
jgi:hypothetical protein